MPLYTIGYIDANNQGGIDVYNLTTFTPTANDLNSLTVDDDDGFLNYQGGGDSTPGTAVGDPESAGTDGFEDGETVQYYARYTVTGDDGSSGHIYLMSNGAGAGIQGVTADFPLTSGVTYTVGSQASNVNLPYSNFPEPIIIPDNVVDGEETGEVMGVGYDDSGQATNGGGDQITDGDDVIEGNGGDDTIDGGGGNDTIDGGDGNDTIYGGDGSAGPSGTFTATENVTFQSSFTNQAGSTVSQTVTSSTGTLNTYNYLGVNGYWVGNGSVDETHTHSFSEGVAGANIRFTATDDGETWYVILDGEQIDLNQAIADGTVTLTNYAISPDGGVTGAGSSGDTGVLDVQIPFNTLEILNNSAGGANGTIYELNVYTDEPVFSDGDGNDDVILGGDGDDTIDGGDGDDLIVGDNATVDITEAETLVTDSGSGTQTDLSSTYRTGVSGTLTDGNGDTCGWEVTDRTGYTGESTYNGVSGGWMQGLTGDSMSLSFDQPLAGLVMDAAGNNSGTGNLLQVTIDGNVVDLNDLVASGEAVLTGSASVSADGRLEIGVNQVGGIKFLTQINDITVQNASAGGSASDYTNIDFAVDDGVTVTDVPASTSISDESGTGDDVIDGGAGNDTIYGGGGDDTIALNDSFGNDTVVGGETGETNGDTLDASALTGVIPPPQGTADGDPNTGSFFVVDGIPTSGVTSTINVDSIGQFTANSADGRLTVGDTINGQTIVNATYAYMNPGEGSVNMLDGTSLTATDNDEQPTIMAIQFYELSDGTTLATLSGVGEDTGTYFSYAITDEVIENGSGVSSITVADTAQVTSGAWISDQTRADLFDMGDDIFPAGQTDVGVTVTATGDEAGTLEQGVNSVDYVEIENFVLTDFDDTGDFSFDGSGVSVDAGGGADTITGGAGDDSIDGGAGDDVIFGDAVESVAAPGAAASSSIDLTAPYLRDQSDLTPDDTASETIAISDGVTSSSVGVTYALTGTNPNVLINTNDDGQGVRSDWVSNSTDPFLTLDFADEVDGVTFDITEIDENTAFSFDDRVTIRAFDADGNPVPVSVSGTTHHIVLEDGTNGVLTVEGESTGTDAVSISVDGPVARIEIIHTNGADAGTSGYVDIENIEHGPILLPPTGGGNDTIDGGLGADAIDGGDGDDLIQLSDTFGDDTIVGGEAGETSGDTLDASALTSGVTVTATGDEAGTVANGGDTATYSEIENFTLTDFDDTADFSADGSGVTVDAGAGADTIDGGGGSDSLTGGVGDDLLTTGSGDDTVILSTSGGADTVTDFDVTDDDSNGFFNDQLDVSDLTGGTGPAGSIRVQDVSVTDDGSGNALLAFPGGETVLLQGVAPNQINTGPQLYAAGVPCFTPGIQIATARGLVPAEQIRVGDLLQTADNGLQPVIWTGCRDLGHQELALQPNLRPVLLQPGGIIGNQAPMMVSPQHRFLTGGGGSNASAGLLGLQDEHFIRARLLVDQPKSRARVAHGVRSVRYIHFMTEQHQVIFANGVATETFWPGPQALLALSPAARSELFAIFPDLRALFALPRKKRGDHIRSVYGDLCRTEVTRKTLRAIEAPRLQA